MTFYKREVVDQVKKNFVAVSIDGYFPGSSTDLEFVNGCRPQTNGCTYVTAGGKVLGRDEFTGPAHMQEVLARFRELPETERKPKIDKPENAGPSGAYAPLPPVGLVARAYCTYLRRDEKGEFSRARAACLDIDSIAPMSELFTSIEMVWIKEEECRAMVPSGLKKGDRLPVPAAVERQLIGLYGGDHLMATMGGFDGSGCLDGRIRSGKLTLTVEETSGAGTALRLEGEGRTGAEFNADSEEAGCDLHFLGFLNYNAQKKAFDRFDVIAVGESWGSYTNLMNGIPREQKRRRWPIGIAFEIASEKPADRVPPVQMLLLRAKGIAGGNDAAYYGKVK